MQILGKNSTSFPLALFLLIISLFVVSCTNPNAGNSSGNSNVANRNANADNSRAVKDDVGELNSLINFPESPEEVVWREETVSQKGKKLTAVLKYANESIPKVIASAERHKPAAQAEIGVEDWFPEELTAQAQLSGNESLKGSVYAANDFYNAPYTNGKLVRIQETNYFVLELTAF